MKHYLMLLTLCCIGLVSLAQNDSGKTAFTLQEAQAYALSNNDSLKLLELDKEIAEKQVIETRAIGLPQVNIESSFQYYFDIPTQLLPDFVTPSVYGVLIQEGVLEPQPIPEAGLTPAQFGTDYNIKAGVNANQLIFDGQYIVGLRASRTFKELSATMLNTSKVNVKANVTRLYLQVLVLQESVKLLEKNASELDKNLSEVQALFKEGLADELDVDRLKLTKQRVEHQVVTMGRTYEIVQLLLKLQMGYPVENAISLSDNLEQHLDGAAQELLTTNAAPKNRPEYKTLLVNQQLQELDMQRYRAGYLPQLSGFFSYSENLLVNDLSTFDEGENWFPTTLAGVQLNIPVFDGLTKSAKIQQAKIEMEKAEIQIHQFEESVKMQVMTQKNNYLNAQESFDIEKANMELARKIYDRAKVKYEEGVGSSLEMTTALTDYYSAQSAYVNASYELIKAQINLEKALGKFD